MCVYEAAIVHAPLVPFDAYTRRSKNISATFPVLAIGFSWLNFQQYRNLVYIWVLSQAYRKHGAHTCYVRFFLNAFKWLS